MTARFVRAAAAALLASVAVGMTAVASDFGNQPTLGAITPWVVAPGQYITITGNHFSSEVTTGNCQVRGVPTVRFRPLDGSQERTATPPASDASWCTNTMVKVQVPGGFGGGALVAVTDPQGQTSNTGTSGFYPQVTFPPSAGLSPGSGGVGTSSVRVSGGNLRPPNAVDNSQVLTFNGGQRGASSWSDSEIVFAPGNASGAVQGQFKVTTDANNSSANLQTVTFDAGTYTFLPPSLQGSTIGGQVVGSSITFPGANLGNSRGTVTFAGGIVRQTASWGDSGITILVPAGARTGSVTANVPGFGAISGPAVEIDPMVKTITPGSGSAGTVFRATGFNFGSGSGAVSTGGVVQQVVSWTDTEVRFTLSGDTDTGSTVITRGDGAAANAPDLKIAPRLDRLDGDNQPVGGQVVADGVSLGSQQGTVTVGGVSATPLLWSRSSVLVAIPAGVAIGKHPLVVTNAAGVASNPLSLLVAEGKAADVPGTPGSSSGASSHSGSGSAPVVFDENHTFVKPVKPPSPVQLVLTADPHDSPAGGTANLTVKLTLNGRPVNGAAIKLSMLMSPDKDYAITPETGTTDADGVFKAKVKISSKGGENVILAESGVFSDQDHVKGAGGVGESAVASGTNNPATSNALPFLALSVVAAVFVCGGVFFNLRSMRLLAP